MKRLVRIGWIAMLLLAGCSGDAAAPGGGGHGGGPSRGGGPGRGGPPGGARGDRSAPAVPVEIAPVVRRGISSYIETNGTLEAENEVDILARTSDPIVALLVEEGDAVKRGQLLVRLDDREHRADLEIARVTLKEMELAFERAKRLKTESLISPESYEEALSNYETARAQHDGAEIQLGYTEIRAPFDGLIIARYVNFAEQVSTNTPLLRISDFDPLLCPIQVPERELTRLRIDQRAYLTVESFPDERFEARVLRIRPVVDAATGTVKVTLAVKARGKLRPGMFARVYVETDKRSGALVIPKAALSLESIGDTIYVADEGVAARREVELGYREGDFVEVVSGVAESETVVVVGQDGLSDGTPVQVLAPTGSAPGDPAARDTSAAQEEPPGRRGPGGQRPDFSKMTPEQLEQAKERMRQRGMTEEQIEERIKRMREGSGGNR